MSPDQQAARWRALVDLGLTPEQESAFDAWISDPLHYSAYQAMDRTMAGLDALKFHPQARLLETELDQLPLHKPKRAGWRIAALATAAAAAIAFTYLGWYRPNYYSHTLATTIGEVTKLELPDGSVLQLNTNTVVDVRYSPGDRRISLWKGEAHFAVAKNKERPFIVTASGLEVRAVGTAFDVRLHSSAVEVLVTEGKVRVGESAAPEIPNPQFLVAGERAMISREIVTATPPAPAIATVPAEEITRVLAWQDQRLVFVSAPLSEIVEEFNRHNEQQLVIADPELASRHFGGTFQSNDPSTLVQLLESSYHVTAKIQGSRTILSLAR